MECYFGHDDEDFVVPGNQESQHSLLSPYNSGSWGVNYSENYASLNKSCAQGRNSFEEEIRFAVDMETRGQNGVNYSNRSVCGRSMEGYPQRRLPFEKPDFQLNDITELDHMDDIFLSSIFEDNVIGMDNGAFDYSPESHFSMTQEDKSMDWEEDEDDMSNLNLSNTRQKHNLPEKVASVGSGAVSSGQTCWDEQLGIETSSEDFVLKELERVMAQMSGTTRISFRDALYRLAENSKQHAENERVNEENLESSSLLNGQDETNRLVETATESATNVIDRTVAFLMFNQMDFNAQNTPSADLNGGVEEPFDYSMGESEISHSTSTEPDTDVPTLEENRSADAEVPGFGRAESQT